MHHAFFWTVGFCLLASASLRAAGPAAADAEKFFEARVRPVLSEHCFRCHGPHKQRSNLRLDSRAATLRGGDNGPALKPGDAEGSLLIQAVRHVGDLKMPPEKKLPPEAIEALTAWVKAGAPWPESRTVDAATDAWKRHWAFQPVRRPEPPAVKEDAAVRNPIDRFLLARLEEKGLRFSPPADRRTFIRRVTYDLIGLPPTPEEVAAFEADPAPDAYERLIERLLASPHYGERWGRHWLDVARYADTKGYVFFEEANYPWAYTYRDYVARAFNEDLPYDEFVLQQLAADRLPLGHDKRPLTALGFLTVGGHFMNNQHDILDDRIDVVTRGLLGLTVSCARCHDHKFDPIPQKDYYSLYGVFASSVEPAVPPLFAPPPATAEYAKFVQELEAREAKLEDFLRTKHAELIASARTRAAEYLLAAHALRDQPSTEEFMLIADGNDLNPTMIVRWQALLNRTRKAHHPVMAPWHALAALPENDFPARARELVTRWLSHPNPAHPMNSLLVRALVEKPPRSLTDVAQTYSRLLNETEPLWQEASQRIATALPDPEREALRRVFHGPDAPPDLARTEINDLALLPDRPAQAKLQELRKAVEQWRISGPGAPPRAMVLEDVAKPYRPRVFLRGNPNQLGEFVPRQFLAVLAGEDRRPFASGSGRLELAHAIASRDNPLTARVLVNRVWMHHFGAGLVRTPSDFGLRSDPPSHPELLDYLASVFMDGGWSIKRLHRLILLSAAYQQRSEDRSDGQRLDPDNRLLWRANRRRLDLEATRDALLAVAGRLDRTLGGPPVKDVLAPSARRRTLYGFIDRLQVPGLFRAFDFPSPDATSPGRDDTTVPQQALFLMNGPFVRECARSLAHRSKMADETNLLRRVERLYRIVYARPPTAEEIDWAQRFLEEDKDSALAWERYAQALLLTNEFVFID
jgi:cytochrome c553